MCLQEVDRFHDLEEELAIRGYAGIWKMRTGNAVDGCAIFWQTNRFQLRHEEHIEFNKLGLRDNVAQICVLESNNRNPSENPSLSFPSSSDQSGGVNQVVICNIHVLFNPKRGEMKLGQVRLLLDRAYAVSRIWNDAPVVVCGDFNSTPMSPLYKFISERKLSLSALTRDQISGQYASSIYAPRPYLGSGLNRPQHSIDNGMEAMNVKQGNIFERIDSDHKPQNDIENSSQKQILSNTESCSGEFQMGHEGNSSASQTIYSIQSTLNGCGSPLNKGIPKELSSHDLDSSSDKELCQELEDILHGEMNISITDSVTSVVPIMHEDLTEDDNLKDNMNMVPSVEDFGTSVSSLDRASGSPSLNAEMPVPENAEPSPALASKEKVDIDISLQNTCRMNEPNSCTCSSSLTDVDRTMVENLLSDDDYGNTSSVKMLQCTKEISSLDIDDRKIYIDSNCEESNQSSVEPVSAGGSFSEQLDDQSAFIQGSSVINESCGSEETSDPNFFRELIGTEDSGDCTEFYAKSNFSPSPGPEAGNADTSANASVPFNLHNSDQDPPTATTGFSAANMEYSYNPYLWTPAEIEVASGNAGCALVEHRLKLRSAYTDVEDCSGTKDSNREPEVTSYHRLFMGTVDYIWYSEGLQTTKVLDTIPKHVLRRTPGFPTRKWGSDHLALACELAFTKSIAITK